MTMYTLQTAPTQFAIGTDMSNFTKTEAGREMTLGMQA